MAAVTAGVSDPELIIQGSASPHTFSLRPSDARDIQDADIVFLVGDAFETSIAGSIDTLAGDAHVVRLADSEGLNRLALREGATFAAHEREESHGHEADAHDHHADEDGAFDMHIWLDPLNAGMMVRTIADALSTTDPDNAGAYTSNAEAVLGRLEALTEEIHADIAKVRDRPFIVFHDAYQYFEDRFGLSATGSASVSPDRPPGARRIAELREGVREFGVSCVLAEPQFDPRLAKLIVEGTSARLGVVDPLGATLDSGPDMYFELLRDMASAFTHCLGSPG